MTTIEFQSTQPEWAATSLVYKRHKLIINFNPRSPSGLRQRGSCLWLILLKISIHAARVGCDKIFVTSPSDGVNFNPRSPSGLRRALQFFTAIFIDFNPRSPSGLRHVAVAQW